MTTNLQHSTGRQIEHLTHLTSAEIESRLQALISLFGQRWLEHVNNHPLQKLWLRKDALATNQLLLLGDAVLAFSATEKTWLLTKVNEIKVGQQNTRRGAVFELLGTNLLRARNCSSSPTPRNHPGYDVVVTTPDCAKLYVSLKSHGTSIHEQIFITESQKIEKLFIEKLEMTQQKEMTLRVISSSYPSASDWKMLGSHLIEMFSGKNFKVGEVYTVGEIWKLAAHPAPREVLPLSGEHLSYQVLILSPHHTNEAKNLLDKFDSAASNAKKHIVSRSSDVAHAVLVKLPETISLETCTQWAQQYVSESPDGPIDLIILYQPTVVDGPNDTSVIDHGIIFQTANCFSKWVKPGRTLLLEPLIGVCFGSPTKRQLSGHFESRVLDGMYSYQRGQFFTAFDFEPSGTLNARLNNLASGVHQHAVVRVNGAVVLTLNGIFPPEKSLSLFE